MFSETFFSLQETTKIFLYYLRSKCILIFRRFRISNLAVFCLLTYVHTNYGGPVILSGIKSLLNLRKVFQIFRQSPYGTLDIPVENPGYSIQISSFIHQWLEKTCEWWTYRLCRQEFNFALNSKSKKYLFLLWSSSASVKKDWRCYTLGKYNLYQ